MPQAHMTKPQTIPTQSGLTNKYRVWLLPQPDHRGALLMPDACPGKLKKGCATDDLHVQLFLPHRHPSSIIHLSSLIAHSLRNPCPQLITPLSPLHFSSHFFPLHIFLSLPLIAPVTPCYCYYELLSDPGLDHPPLLMRTDQSEFKDYRGRRVCGLSNFFLVSPMRNERTPTPFPLPQDLQERAGLLDTGSSKEGGKNERKKPIWGGMFGPSSAASSLAFKVVRKCAP